MKNTGSTLSSRLISDIQQYAAEQGLRSGDRLVERPLAEHFRVSRSPVRTALQTMAEQGLLTRHPEGGFAIAVLPATPPLPPEPSQTDAEAAYLQIAQDRLQDKLPERVTENELMRRYELTKSQLAEVLRRMSNEGWIERLPGHGWAFQATLTSADAYVQSYRFRVLMEPAGILEPAFLLDRERLLRCREEQDALVQGAVHTASPAQLFDANTRLHETIAACSGNMFIADSLRRLNRVRRLMEYQKAVDREQARRRCVEHLKLIDLLLDGQQEAAADYMRFHLRSASLEKTSRSAQDD